MLAMAAGAVGGETSNGGFGAPAAGPDGGLAIRDPRSSLLGGSGPSSRRIRGADGGCGGPRSALGPVGAITGARDGSSERGFSILSRVCSGAASDDDLSGGPGMGAVTDPNAGTCGADGGGERLTVGGRSLGASGRGRGDSHRSGSRRFSGIDGFRMGPGGGRSGSRSPIGGPGGIDGGGIGAVFVSRGSVPGIRVSGPVTRASIPVRGRSIFRWSPGRSRSSRSKRRSSSSRRSNLSRRSKSRRSKLRSRSRSRSRSRIRSRSIKRSRSRSRSHLPSRERLRRRKESRSSRYEPRPRPRPRMVPPRG